MRVKNILFLAVYLAGGHGGYGRLLPFII